MKNSNRSAGLWFMLAVVGVSMIARALVIWFTRPEFAGWFNHTYYYFVQVRGILAQGSMPFSDLPLLFYTYAAVAALLTSLGASAEFAIVNTSRFLMSIIPALTAVPVYFLLRSIRNGSRMDAGDKLLVIASAFLPLNLVHMPELLQKNTLGILLFACLLFTALKLLEGPTILRGALAGLLLALIASTHFGTLAVSMLFLASLSLALVVTEGLTRRSLAVCAGGILAVLSSAALLLLLVPERFGRIAEYASANLRNSLAGRLFFEGGAADKFLYLAGIAVPLILMLLAVRRLATLRAKPSPAGTFVLANVFLAYFLLAPFVDTSLIPRFLLFISLPAIVIAAALFRESNKRLIRFVAATALLVVCSVIVFGEVMGTLMRNDANRSTQSELVRLRESGIVSPDDLIVTTYGVNPICNWFLGTKSALITAVEIADLSRRERFFVLVTESAAFDELPVDRDGDGRLSDVEKYYASRRPLELPTGARSTFRGNSFELFELATVPQNWEFDREGNWIGYGESER